MKIYIYSKQHAHGIVVIIENIIAAFNRKGIDCCRIESLDGRTVADTIIPYGVMEANELLDAGLPAKVCFPADAITLGYRNKIKFYLSIGHVFNYDFFYSIYAYLKFFPKEKRMIRSFQKNVLVSNVDIDYFKKHICNQSEKYIYATNGVEIPEQITNTSNNPSEFRLGILSPWKVKQITEESLWFVKKYFLKYITSHPNVFLYIAGRGKDSAIFEGMKNVRVIGEVESLSDFFSNIDVMISSNPKGCGILNRVLDSFAHKVPVLGHVGSFTGFPNSEGCYFSFDSYESFCSQMDLLMNNKDEMKKRADNAYEYILKNNNWIKLYDTLVNKLIETI